MGKQGALDTHSTTERHIIDFRRLGWKDVMVLGKYHYKQAQACLGAHTHRDMLEICFCSKGEQVYKVNKTLYRIKGGELFVTFPGELHGTGEYPEEKGEMYWVIIRTDRARRFLHFEGRLAAEWNRQLLQLPRHFKGNRTLKLKLEKIFQCHAMQSSLLKQIKMQHLLADFLLEVFACSQSAAFRKKTKRMEEIDAYMREHIDEPVMLQQLAALSGLSVSRFKAWFKEETGTTPLDYILKYKIKKAQEYLQEEARSITSIAYDTGFQSTQYFATVFRKFTGMQPREYRQQWTAR